MELSEVKKHVAKSHKIAHEYIYGYLLSGTQHLMLKEKLVCGTLRSYGHSFISGGTTTKKKCLIKLYIFHLEFKPVLIISLKSEGFEL